MARLALLIASLACALTHTASAAAAANVPALYHGSTQRREGNDTPRKGGGESASEFTRLDFSLKADTEIPQEDYYMCRAVKMPEEDGFIVEYEDHFNPEVVHHALLFGCNAPPTQDEQWYVRVFDLVRML